MGRSGCVASATSAILTHTLCARRVAASVAALRPASSPSSMMASWRKCEEWSAAQMMHVVQCAVEQAFRRPCRYSCVCPKGANYQWGKDPLE
jgi:hypothetical protein